MRTHHPIVQLKNILFITCLALFIVACDKGEEISEAATIVIPELNDSNIKAFTLTFAKDYFVTAKILITAFISHKEAEDSYGFTRFRNHQWTPAYIEKKDYYQSVFTQNKKYLAGHSVTPLFSAFENLLYIGVNLKNALLDGNAELAKEALDALKQDKQSVRSIVKALK